MSEISLCLDSGETLVLAPQEVWVAGYTARNQEEAWAHIQELAEQGVPAPESIPAFYEMPVSVLTQQSQWSADDPFTSGEVELVLVGHQGELFLTLGSDHTNRTLEAKDIAESKRVCPKWIGQQAWRYGEVKDHLDSLVLKSYIWEKDQKVLYQEGKAQSFLPLHDLLSRAPFSTDNFVLFGGTLSALGGLRPSTQFWAEVFDPQINQTIGLHYAIDLALLPSS